MQFTLIRSDQPEILTKRFALDKDGVLTKTTVGHLSRGRASSETVADMAVFGKFIEGLRPDQALAYGRIVGDLQMATIVTRKAYGKLTEHQRVGVVTRSNDHFEWGTGAGVMQIDVDPLPDGTVLPPAEFLKLLDVFLPEAREVPKVFKPSASSYIYNSVTGEELTGLRGYRIYLAIDDAAKIRNVAETLDTRLKAGGYGQVSITKNGQMRDRSPIDMAVYTPCHLDFAAGAATGETC
mgnify:CR=1 FL=1